MAYRLLHMDCMEFLDTVQERSVDLAVIDPPYNLNMDRWDSFASHQEFTRFTFGWIDKLVPKLKRNASLYVFNTPYNSAFILQHLVEKKMTFQNWITWDKRDGLSYTKRRFANGQETILFFTNGGRHTFNYDRVRVPYESTERMRHAKLKGIVKNGRRWYPNPKGRLCGEIWHMSSERHKSKVNGRLQKMPHRTIKPMEMIERIVLASSKKNDLVLDCFAGSGTTALVCKRLGRNFIGCDSNRRYVLAARRRIRTGVLGG